MQICLSLPATTEAPPSRPEAVLGTNLQIPRDLLFTYGTLMRGQARHDLLAREIFEGEAYLVGGSLWDTGYGFPALTLNTSPQDDEPDPVVWGEVYRITHPATWATLDQVESGLYTRLTHRVHLPGKATANRSVQAQVYVALPILRPEAMRKISTGRWTEYANA